MHCNYFVRCLRRMHNFSFTIQKALPSCQFCREQVSKVGLGWTSEACVTQLEEWLQSSASPWQLIYASMFDASEQIYVLRFAVSVACSGLLWRIQAPPKTPCIWSSSYLGECVDIDGVLQRDIVCLLPTFSQFKRLNTHTHAHTGKPLS